MSRKSLLIALMLAVSACDSIPRDPEGSLTRIEQEGAFRVGVIAPGGSSAVPRLDLALVDRVASVTGAEPVTETASADRLLLRLEEGELDLVVGEMLAETPWRERVHVLPALAQTEMGGADVHVAGAARQGENAWIMLLEREARRLAEEK